MSSAGLFWRKGAFIQLGTDQALLEVWRAWRLTAEADAPPTVRWWQSRETTLIAKQHPLAFLSFFKQLRRPRHLDGYNDADLGGVSGSGATYHASTIEQHRRELSQAPLGQPWAAALAGQYWGRWYADGQMADRQVFYLDSHEKLVWTQPPVAKGFVSARHEVHACLKQFYLHGRGGHGLDCETHSGDAHLSQHRLALIERFEPAIGQAVVHGIVADREGLSAEVLVELHPRKKPSLRCGGPINRRGKPTVCAGVAFSSAVIRAPGWSLSAWLTRIAG